MSFILPALFFASGVAGLVFETLWLRQAGLTFGNSIGASSPAPSSFMAGLALGKGLVAGPGARIRRPVRLYAWLEAAIATVGVGLVWQPLLSGWLAPLRRPFLDQPCVLSALRLGSAFA